MTDQSEIAAAPKKSKRAYNRRSQSPAKLDALSLLQTPEAQDVIAAAVAAAVAKLAEKRVEAGTKPAEGDLSMIRGLAVAISELNDQGNKQKRIPAEELERRQAAGTLMQELILNAAAQDKSPEYYVNRKTYLAEELIDPTFVGTDKVQRRTKIVWRGVPNEALEPVEGNHAAHEIYAAFIESIGGRTPHAHRANYTIDGKTMPAGELTVLHKGLRAREAPIVGRARGGVEHVGRHLPGEIVETNVLGTLAQPARQVA